jgi:hypothetical protein
MAEDTTPDTVDDTTDDLDTTTPDTEPDTQDADTEPDKVDRSELEKVIAQRDKVKAELRAIKNKDKDKPDADTPDPLRTALRRTAAEKVLIGRGITDESEQAAVLSVFHLDALDIGEDGTVDTDTLADTLDTLGRIFGKGKDTKRTAPAVDTRRGSRDGGDNTDPDTRRYKRIMGRA